MRTRSAMFILIGFFVSVSQVWAANYTVDVTHSSVTFKVRHLLSNVQGQFNTFEGVIEYEPGKQGAWAAKGKIDTASINTNVAKRDEHLRSADFFEVEKYPTIEFQTSRVLESTDTHAKLEGLLAMHGVERPVVLDVDIHGIAKDPWGNTRAGFTVTAKISRKEYGLIWNKTLETEEFLVGDEIQITIEVEAIQSPVSA